MSNTKLRPRYFLLRPAPPAPPRPCPPWAVAYRDSAAWCLRRRHPPPPSLRRCVNKYRHSIPPPPSAAAVAAADYPAALPLTRLPAGGATRRRACAHRAPRTHAPRSARHQTHYRSLRSSSQRGGGNSGKAKKKGGGWGAPQCVYGVLRRAAKKNCEVIPKIVVLSPCCRVSNGLQKARLLLRLFHDFVTLLRCNQSQNCKYSSAS